MNKEMNNHVSVDNTTKKTEQLPPQTDVPTVSSRTKSTNTKTLVIGLAGGVLGAALVTTSVFMMKPWENAVPSQSHTTTTSSTVNSQVKTINSTVEDADITKAITHVKDTVVSIANYQTTTSSSLFSFQENGTLQKAGEGSGVIYKITDDGYVYIVTNNHVIANAKELSVLLSNGTSLQAELVGADSLTDLAVIRVKNDNSIIKQAATFANSDNVTVGQTALAIGSPLGSELASTVTRGIVSAVNRSVSTDTDGDNINDWTMETIQTDAAINPGNSGGGLVDLNGNIIGINSMKISNTSVEGIGFAIPSNQVISIVNELEANGKVTRPTLGIGLVDLSNVATSQRKNLLNLPNSVESGVVVGSVQSRSNASLALEKYDVIVGWNGKEVSDSLSLRKHLYAQKIGDTVTLDVYRNGELKSVSITLSSRNPIDKD